MHGSLKNYQQKERIQALIAKDVMSNTKFGGKIKFCPTTPNNLCVFFVRMEGGRERTRANNF